MRYFVLLCLVALAAAQTNDCDTYSWAQPAVAAIKSNLAASSFDGLTTQAAVNTAILSLYNITSQISNGFVLDAFTGRSPSNDFYMVKNCKNQEGANAFCSATGATQYLGYVRNDALFPNTTDLGKRRVYNINTDGTIGTLLGMETSAYVATSRVWYTGAPGWTSGTFASGGVGRTYSESFGNGVVAADRVNREYCGPCFSNSYAVPVSKQIAATNLRQYRAITSNTQFTAIATLILTALKEVNSTSSVNAFVGYENDNSYMVKVCGAAVNAGVAQCTGNAFLFYVANAAVHGNQSRIIYALSSTGAVGAQLAQASASYTPTTTDWYKVQGGWSPNYNFASGGTGATYTETFNGGVVGTDRVSTEACNRTPQVVTVQTTCPNTNSAATSALGCGVALAAAAAAYAL